MAKSKRTKGTTAAEVQRELQARLDNDPEFAREMAARDAERQERVQRLRLAEQPIVKDLRDAGYEVSSVWDLVNTSVPYPDALPVLLAHLQRGGYPDRVPGTRRLSSHAVISSGSNRTRRPTLQ